MKGLEMMLSNMLGISPAEMKALFEGVAKAADTAVLTLQKIERQNDEILSLLKGAENGHKEILDAQADGNGSRSGLASGSGSGSASDR